MKFKKTVLPSGLRIITVPLKDSQSAIAMVLVEAGSHYEDEKINGLSHFLEHMCFKGTKKQTGVQIKEKLDRFGTGNAFTGPEYTGYYARSNGKNTNKLVDFVSDIYLNSVFPEKDILTERGVIIEELNMYEDMPDRAVQEVFEELLYPDQPAGRKIIGTKKNLMSFNRDDFIKYHKDHYVAKKTTVVVAGNIDQTEVIKKVKESFKDTSEGKVIKKPKVIEKQTKPQVKLKYKKTDQAHLVIGFRSFDLHDKRNHALTLAASILGSGFSSRLFKRMRDELGMCYYCYSDIDKFTDHGTFQVLAGVTVNRVEEAVEAIVEEFKRLKTESVDPKELKKAKEMIVNRKALSLETAEQYAMYYGIQELLHKEILKPREYLKKIKGITEKDIKRVFNQIAIEKNLNLAIVGPFKDKKKFEKLLKL
jgi:predicted Zn-dependent peptidase